MSKQYRIEKNIPIPKPNSQSKYPFGEMAIGDSFLAPSEKKTSISAAISSFRKTHPDAFFAQRRVSETEIRVWRVDRKKEQL